MSSVPITPGAGANIAADQVSGIDFQIVKLDVGGTGASVPVVGTTANGLPVDVTRVQGTVSVVSPAASTFKVDASGATVPISAASSLTVAAPSNAPVAVRLSDGTNPVDTIPVSGTLTVNQGNIGGSPWPVTIPGTVNVNIVSGGGEGSSQVDSTAFTASTSDVTVQGAVYNDAIGSPSAGQAAAVRMSQSRGLHANLRNAAGTETGTAGSPLRIDPTGATAQPVTANITSINGTAVGAINPLPVLVSSQSETRVSKGVAMTASQTDAVVWTPAAGKKFSVSSLIITASVGGTLKVYDNANASANMLYQGTVPIGLFVIPFPKPWNSAAINNQLLYTSGSGLTGDLTLAGTEI